MNLPNALSLLRIFLVTPFLIAVIYRRFSLALAIFVVAGISDFLDGYLARRLRQKSLLGSFLDPLGDKLLSTVAFVTLAIQDLIPPWLAVTVVAKDAYVALGSGILYLTGHFSVADPSAWGKLSTLLQMVTVGFVLLSASCEISDAFLRMLFFLTGTATAIAFFDYLRRGVRLFPENADHR